MAAENVPKPPAEAGRPMRVRALRITPRSRLRAYASFAALASAAIGLHAALTDVSAWVITHKEGWFVLSLLVTPLCMLVALTTRRPKPLEACHSVARVTDGWLRVDGTADADVAREDIADGWFVDPGLHLKKRDGDEITIILSEPEAGPRILTSLGLGPGQRALRVTLAAPADRVLFGRLAATVVAAALSPALGCAAFYAHYIATERVWHKPVPGEVPLWVAITAGLAGALALSLRLLWRGHVKVGADGVSLRPLLRRRFYPYARLAAVRARPSSVCLDVIGRRPVSVRLGAWDAPRSPEFDEIARRHAALARRIEEARAAGSGSRAPPHPDLDRAGRSVTAWRAHLARLATLAREVTSYRETPIAADELAAVVESAGAPAERRVAAAVVLADSARDHAARSVRVAIDASADDELRAALEHAADGDLDERVLRRRG